MSQPFSVSDLNLKSFNASLTCICTPTLPTFRLYFRNHTGYFRMPRAFLNTFEKLL